MAVDQQEHIFEKGVSSKGRGRRGVGCICPQRLDEMSGQDQEVGRGGLGGALFTAIISRSKDDDQGTLKTTASRTCTTVSPSGSTASRWSAWPTAWTTPATWPKP